MIMIVRCEKYLNSVHLWMWQRGAGISAPTLLAWSSGEVAR